MMIMKIPRYFCRNFQATWGMMFYRTGGISVRLCVCPNGWTSEQMNERLSRPPLAPILSVPQSPSYLPQAPSPPPRSRAEGIADHYWPRPVYFGNIIWKLWRRSQDEERDGLNSMGKEEDCSVEEKGERRALFPAASKLLYRHCFGFTMSHYKTIKKSKMFLWHNLTL